MNREGREPSTQSSWHQYKVQFAERHSSGSASVQHKGSRGARSSIPGQGPDDLGLGGPRNPSPRDAAIVKWDPPFLNPRRIKAGEGNTEGTGGGPTRGPSHLSSYSHLHVLLG